MPPDMPYKERYRSMRNKVMTYIRMYITYHLFVNDASDGNGFIPGFVPGRPPAIGMPPAISILNEII